jgi:hypothetical protein
LPVEPHETDDTSAFPPVFSAARPGTSLFAWCESVLGERPAEVILRAGHLSQVLVMVLAGGRHVVVKARPFEPRLLGCAAVQRSLATRGFPCPAPLAGPEVVGALAVSAETLVDAGAQRDVAAGVRRSPPCLPG